MDTSTTLRWHDRTTGADLELVHPANDLWVHARVYLPDGIDIRHASRAYEAAKHAFPGSDGRGRLSIARHPFYASFFYSIDERLADILHGKPEDPPPFLIEAARTIYSAIDITRVETIRMELTDQQWHELRYKIREEIPQTTINNIRVHIMQATGKVVGDDEVMQVVDALLAGEVARLGIRRRS